MRYQVAINNFEGPLDLLLQLIEKQQLPITSIAIADVTSDYLDHMTRLKETNPSNLSWFIEIASRLIYIKSRALIPQAPDEDEDAAGLTQQIAAYRCYKQAAFQLQNLKQQHGSSYERVAAAPAPVFVPPKNLDLAALQQSMQAVLARLPEETITAPDEAQTFESTMTTILAQVSSTPLQLSSLTGQLTCRFDAIVFFIAILELIKQGAISARQEATFDDVTIEAVP